MKTGYVNLVAGTLALVFAVLWALQSPDITAVFAIIASFFWIGFGLFQLAASDRTVVDWI